MDKSKLAKVISTILNPFILFAPVQLVYFILLERIPQNIAMLLGIIVLQAILPFVLIIIFMKLKFISDFEISNKNQRTGYFAIVTVLFMSACLLSASIQQISLINVTLAITLLIITIINLSWKISGHLAFDTVLFLGLITINPAFLITVILLPLVAWSRIVLKKHSIAQTIGGILLGAVVFAIVYLLS